MKEEAKQIYLEIKKDFCKYIKVKNSETVYYACARQAYKDLMFRTLKGHTTKYKEDNLQQISLILEKYKNEPTLEIINRVSKVFEKEFTECELDKSQLFGKSQKVVNMAFKYLYCLNADIDYSKCDIPLDSRIIDYYVERRKMYDNITIASLPVWSHLSEEEYLKIQSKLKEYYLKDGLNMMPLEAEYIIWAYATVKINSRNLSKFSPAEINAYNLLKR